MAKNCRAHGSQWCVELSLSSTKKTARLCRLRGDGSPRGGAVEPCARVGIEQPARGLHSPAHGKAFSWHSGKKPNPRLGAVSMMPHTSAGPAGMCVANDQSLSHLAAVSPVPSPARCGDGGWTWQNMVCPGTYRVHTLEALHFS